MRAQRAATLAWPLSALGLALGAGVVFLDILNRAHLHRLHDWQPVGVVMAVSFSLLGAVIVSRQPGNRIGWIYLWIGIAIPAQGFASAYFERSVIAGGLAGARWAAWLSNWAALVVFPTGFALFAFLLFPSGRVPSRRWRAVVWAALAITAVGIMVGCSTPRRSAS